MKKIVVVLFALLLVSGCTIPLQKQMQNVPFVHPYKGSPLVGTWKVFSEYIGYARGGGGATSFPGGPLLYINDDGTWSYGSSQGTWSETDINDSDWTKWKVSSYGPTQKIVLEGWEDQTVDGPIEGTNESVTFIWVIYDAKPPVVSEPAQLQIKFGHQ